MEDTSVEQKVEHHEHQAAPAPVEHHGGKGKFGLVRWLKGANRRERVENTSYLIIVLSAVMVGIGVALGSFIRYTVYIGAFGALLILVGIVIYIVSQLMAKEKGTGEASA